MHVNGNLEHKGIVLSINGERIDVSILSESACATCKVKSACGMSETEETVVSIFTHDAPAYRVGEQVVVSVTRNMGLRAVFLAYVVPFLVLLVSLLVLLEAGLSEAAAGLISLGVLALYYIVLWLMRRRIEREINFNIRKL